MRLLTEILIELGLEIVAVHPRKERQAFRALWRTTFAPDVDWRGFRRDWEPLGRTPAPALTGRKAVQAYDNARAEAPSAFFRWEYGGELVVEVRGVLVEHTALKAAFGVADVTIVAANWDWTFVLTHEDGALSAGPFFIRAPFAEPARDVSS